MNLKINISPCPNDTFMFEAMINSRIDTEGLNFDVEFLDIEQLNSQITTDNNIQISKISYAILPLISKYYRVLDSGSALGFGNGPLLVSHKNELQLDNNTSIVSPGEHTTANLLLKKLFPQLGPASHILFSEIAKQVQAHKFDAGVLIHEGRFTYAEKNLHLVADLGKKWEEISSLPLPLGAIVVNRNLGDELAHKLSRVLRRSIEFARENPEISKDFVASHAQELSCEVIKSHIDMFVNEFSVSLGDKGRRAVMELCPDVDEEIFIR